MNMAAPIISCIFVGLIIHIHSYTFGFNNRYTCHCLNNETCDSTTGGCTRGCLRGWGGPSCQRENVALDSTFVSQSGIYNNKRDLYGPQLVVDGYNSTNRNIHYCSDTDTDNSPWQWWSVDLQQPYSIRYLKIFHRYDKLRYLKGFAVHIDNELCYKHTGDSDPTPVFPVECSRTLTGSSVNISRYSVTQPYIVLCEVEIYICSRGTYGSECNNFCHCLNYDKCDVITGKCPNGCQKGWHGDSCNCTIGTYGDRCNKQCNNRRCKGSQECNHVTGKCTDGCKPGYKDGDCTVECSDGFYGAGCQKNCNNRKCLKNSTCDHVTGECIGGCSVGYSPIDCSRECPNGSYGAGCQKNCNNRKCLKNSKCDHVTGECIGGCSVGYSSIVLDCTQECETGLYGAGCSKKCSDRKCNDNSQCDSKTGECIDGCQPGFQFIDCTLECDEGFYGYNCLSNCSARFCQSQDQCNVIDGACDCLDGYQGTDCTVLKEASKDVDTVNNDKDTTIIILAVVVGILVVVLIIFGVIVFIKYRKYKDTNHTESNIYESTGPTTAHIYDDLVTKEQGRNQSRSSKNDNATDVPAGSDYINLDSRNPENSTSQASPVYYNTTSGVSIGESLKQQTN